MQARSGLLSGINDHGHVFQCFADLKRGHRQLKGQVGVAGRLPRGRGCKCAGGGAVVERLCVKRLESALADVRGGGYLARLGSPAGAAVHLPLAVAEEDADELACKALLVPIPLISVVGFLDAGHGIVKAALRPLVLVAAVIVGDGQTVGAAPLLVLGGVGLVVLGEKVLVFALGNVKGNDKLFPIEIVSGSRVVGDISTLRLRIVDNVDFHGQVTMLEAAPDVDIFSVTANEYKQACAAKDMDE